MHPGELVYVASTFQHQGPVNRIAWEEMELAEAQNWGRGPNQSVACHNS